MPGHELRRARLLSGLLLALILLIVLAFTWSYLNNPAVSPVEVPAFPVAMTAAALLALAYGLNRSGRYGLAAGLTVTIAAIGAWASVITSQSTTGVDPLLLGYLVVSVVLSSTLLSMRITMLLAVVHLVALALFVPDAVEGLIFVGFLSLLLLVASALAVFDRAQIDEQTLALTESEKRYRRLVEQLPVTTYVAGLEGTYGSLYISPQVDRLLGFSASEWLAEPELWLKQVHPDDRERVLELSEQALESGGAFFAEYRLLARDGRIVWVRDEGRVLPGFGGYRRPVLQGVWSDITQRKQAEDLLSRQTARAEALLRVAKTLNGELDLDTVLRHVCDEAATALNVSIASVSLLNPAGDALRMVAAHGLARDATGRMAPLPLKLYEEFAARQGHVIVVPDIQAMPDLPNAELYRGLDLRTTVGVSMLREGQLIGRLNVGTVGQTREFIPDELALLQGLADQAALAISNALLLEQARRRVAQVQSLRSIDNAITASLDLTLTLNIVLDQALSQLEVDAAQVLAFEPYSQSLVHAASRGFDNMGSRHVRWRLGEGLPGRAAYERRTLSGSYDRSKPEDGPNAARSGGDAFALNHAVPLIAKGQVKGVLTVHHRVPVEPGPDWLEFLETLAGQVAIAMDSAEMFESLQRSHAELALAYDTTLEGWARALEMRDRETEGHTRRVTEMTLGLARAMGRFAEAEIVHLRRGALLHDIGKMAIPDHILLKPAALNESEQAVMRRHPTLAYEMLSPIAYLRRALDIPYAHHEKWDGSGYPLGLKGEGIPLAARVFSVVDVWDALRSDRPYRPAWADDQAREHIRSLAGTHFDPAVVEAFLRLLDG